MCIRDRGNADGHIADAHDDPDADAAVIRKLLQKPQHRHAENKHAAEVDEQGDAGFSETIEQFTDYGLSLIHI